MKNKISIVLTALMILGSLSQAAHLVAQEENSGLWGQVDRYINDDDTLVPSESIPDGGSSSCTADISGSTLYSSAQASMSGQVTAASYWGPGLGTAVTLNASADCSSEDPYAQLWSYGNAATLVAAVTDGIFFVIEPDAGESTGRPVRIQWRWSAQCTAFYGNAEAFVSEGQTIYLTRNVLPPTGLPQEGIVWGREGVTFTEENEEEETGSFIAQVGDVIGVFFNAGVRADVLSENSSGAAVSTSMEFLAEVPQLIEYSYAPGLVYDPEQDITFLKDWSAFPDTMNWIDADQEVQDFSFVSNGVTYSNWRLPVTTEGSGLIGELGYLSATYGISDTHLGPFENLLDGDYWTAPQFGIDPDIFAYIFTYSTTYGPSQYTSPPSYECYVLPVFDGPPPAFWCPADFNNDGIVDLADFAAFASYWLSERD
jgi:hypothetical protein